MLEPRIVFMGTPEFAVPSLDLLVQENKNVVAVITSVDKKQGRGKKISSSPVKIAALNHQIDVLQPPNLKSTDFLTHLASYNANIFVVVAFRMLPEEVWSMPDLGTFNLHASLLPQYRGAAPINWAIINGEKRTGVTTFYINHEIDTGSILFQEKEEISEEDTAGTLYERIKVKGASLVLKTVDAIANHEVSPANQNPQENLRAAPKIFRETCAINFQWRANQIHNFVRGLAPYPGAWTLMDGQVLKIFKVELTNNNRPAKPGTIHTDNQSFLHVKALDKWISINHLQIQGKRSMSVTEFLRGNNVTGTTLSNDKTHE